MKMRVVCSGLAASAVLLVSGVAFSGGPTPVQLMDFDRTTGELWGYPQGQPLATYLHQPTTLHEKAILSRFHPPDPCLPLAHVWNVVVEYDQRTGQVSTPVFDALLDVMSRFQCSATIDAGSGSPQPIVTIAPAP
jgi:hypothetical protein